MHLRLVVYCVPQQTLHLCRVVETILKSIVDSVCWVCERVLYAARFALLCAALKLALLIFLSLVGV